MACIDDGIKSGAKVEVGGTRVGDKGYFVAPTIFSHVKDDMKVAREEIFGPVLVVLKFKSVEEVVERANDTNVSIKYLILEFFIDEELYEKFLSTDWRLEFILVT
jgi:aldehyde dehydrogenase (NAD+)